LLFPETYFFNLILPAFYPFVGDSVTFTQGKKQKENCLSPLYAWGKL
jgi:hypothetical protein